MRINIEVPLLVPLALVTALGVTGITAEEPPGDKQTIYQGLDAVFARRDRLAAKTMDPLAQNGVCQTERLIFRDTETGAEVWRLTFDPSMSLIHSHINRSPWNCDGSLLLIRSDRGMPGIWKRKETGRGDPHFYVMQPDGSSFELFRARAPEGKWGTNLNGRHAVWDRTDPRRTYWVTNQSLYAADITAEGVKTTKLSALPHPERRKTIFSYPSENNILMIKDLNSREVAGELYFVDLRKRPGQEGFFFRYPWAFKVEHPKHKQETEFGFHDIYFRRNAADSYIFNFGSSGSVGEALFFEAPLRLDRSKIKICYPDDKLKIPYYSHPAWNHDGRLVSYFGCEEPGPAELNPGWHVRDHDARKDVSRLIPGWVGGHIAWDGYDEEWIFAALSSERFKPEWHGWIAHAYIPDGKAHKLVKHYSRLNGGKNNYAAIARPAQSPDGTKCLYHSTMLHTDDQTMDLYVAVSHRPAPPLELSVAAVPDEPNDAKLTWTPPRMHREVRGYHVYRSLRADGDFAEISQSKAPSTEFIDTKLDAETSYHYFVTSEEHCGLESETTSPVVKFGPAGGKAEVLKPLRSWDTVAPSPPQELTCLAQEDGTILLSWALPRSSDLRYYNIYYSSEKSPEPTQSRRVASPGKLDTTYIDWGFDPEAKQHCYAITAVDRQGNESEPAAGQVGAAP